MSERRGLSPAQLDVLMQDLHPARVATRKQGGKTLSYVESFDIKATLIRVFGFGGFCSEVIDSKIIQIREAAGATPQHVNNDGSPKTPQVIAQATVRLTVYGITNDGFDAVYTETAIGSNSAWDIGDAADNAIKSAASDALKRCATFLGTQFGLSLYANGSKSEIVRVVYEPKQAEALRQIAAERGPVQVTQEQHDNLTRALSASDSDREVVAP